MKRAIFVLFVLAAACDSPGSVEDTHPSKAASAAETRNGQSERGTGPMNETAGVDKPPEAANSTQESPDGGPRTPSSPSEGEAAAQPAAPRGAASVPPPAPDRPEFVYTFRPKAGSSRDTQQRHVYACRQVLRDHCRILESNIRVIDDNDIEGEVTFQVERSSAHGFADRASLGLRENHRGDIVRGEINDSRPAPSAAPAGDISQGERNDSQAAPAVAPVRTSSAARIGSARISAPFWWCCSWFSERSRLGYSSVGSCGCSIRAFGALGGS